MPFANYYSYPGTGPAPKLPGMGAYYSPVASPIPQVMAGFGTAEETTKSSFLSEMFSISSLADYVLKAGAGWYVGRYFGHPVAGAILAATLGLPGIFGLALFSDKPATAVANRRRRHHRRHCRRNCGRGW
jgi:hypothetical protein